MNLNQISRRDFIKAGGALVVSVGVSGAIGSALSQNASNKPPLLPDQLDSWIAVLPDGTVNAYYGKTDMGQGIDVAIGQIVAEELDVAFERVNVILGDTVLTVNQGGASGSTGIQFGGAALRNAAAEARRLLVERAAERLKVPVEMLVVDNGVVNVPGYALQRVSYGDLIGGKYFHANLEWNKQYGNPLAVKGKAAVKKPSEYKVVGKSYNQAIVTEKIFGRQQFVTEMKIDGMLHARVVRPPNAGCGPTAVDENSIKHIAGARVVREKEFIAVVADREWDAVRAAEALKVEWAPACQPFPQMDQLHNYIRTARVIGAETPVKRGDVDAAMKGAQRVVEFEYEWPLQSHSSMGPACAVAHVNGEKSELYTGSQKPHYARNGMSKLVGLKADNIHSRWIPGPGSYGRNDAGDAALDAALISKLTGRPVRLQYMRPDGTAWDPKSPAGVYRGRAGIDAEGNVVAYDFHARGFSRQDVVQTENEPKDTLAGQMTGYAPKGNITFAVPSERYEFANKRCGWECVAPMLDRASPLRTGHLRDPLGAETHFASESFIDEVAHAVGADPVAFRLKYVKDARHAAVIRAAAEKSGWSKRPAGDRGQGTVMRGRGFSYTERNGTVVAMVAEVEVDRASGRIWAKHFTVAHDCGLIINPKGLEIVIEGNVVQATSRTLFEEVRFNRDRVLSVDWATYPILDIMDAPEKIDVVLINRPDVAPSGGGEPSTRTVPAAIANAVFDATGIRMRQAPLTAQKMKDALARVV
jgi:CO/xanthine dehydrogenase Mo-binding subunit